MGLHDLALRGKTVDLLKGVVAPNKHVFGVQDWTYQPQRCLRIMCFGIHAAQVRTA